LIRFVIVFVIAISQLA